MSGRREPPIVAELGRPETAEETALRRAETSRKHRANQTFLNLVVALVASLAVVLVVILVVVRPEPPAAPPIDYRSIAADADTTVPLAAPDLPPGWEANSAVYQGSTSDGVATWYVGFITPQQQFIGVRQGIDANPTWLAQQTKSRAATGTAAIEGIAWHVYDYRDTHDVGNLAYALTTSNASSNFVLFGTATVDEFTILATALSRVIEK